MKRKIGGIHHALQADYEAATDAPYQPEQAAKSGQKRINTGKDDEDGDGVPLAAKDGLRYDYDDSSDV